MSHHTTLVVGATGHVGSSVAKNLARSGHHVRALVRSADRRIHDTDDLDIEYVVGDLTDTDSIDRAVQGVTAIVSSANGNIPIAKGPDSGRLNDIAADVLVSAAVRHGVERFVQSSVPENAWAEQHVPEIAGKRVIEAALEASPLDYTIVRNPAFTDVWLVMCGCLAAQSNDAHATTRRPYGFMRTWQRLTGNLATNRGRLLAPGGADNGSPLVTVRDVAYGMAAAVDSEHTKRRTIEFGGPEWITWSQVANEIGQRLGREVKPLNMPSWFTNTGRLATKPFSASASNVLSLTTYVATHQPRWENADIVTELDLPTQQSVGDYLDEHLGTTGK